MIDATTRPTTVINVSRLTRDRRAALVADPSFIYVGRAFAGWAASVYGNPFKPGMSAHDASGIMIKAGVPIAVWIRLAEPLTITQAVECYRLCWAATRKRRDRIRAELRGRVLGCWCTTFDGVNEPGRPCHGVTLARLADSHEEPDR